MRFAVKDYKWIWTIVRVPATKAEWVTDGTDQPIGMEFAKSLSCEKQDVANNSKSIAKP